MIIVCVCVCIYIYFFFYISRHIFSPRTPPPKTLQNQITTLVRVGMSQLGISTLSRSNRCKIILALKDHSFVESCCIKLLYDCEKEMLLIPEILDAIDLRVLRLEGVHRPRVSTTRGKKEPPAATT